MSKHKSQKKEIIWNIINSALAGLLVLLGALSTGNITKTAFCYALVAASIVMVTKFKDYWAKEENEYTTKMFSFIKL